MALAQAFESVSATFIYEKVLLEEHCAEIELKITWFNKMFSGREPPQVVKVA